MKWTRASERLPEATFPDLYNFGRGPCSQTMPVKFNGVPYSGAYYPKEDFFAIAFHERLYKKEDYDKIEWLDESDESPESSVWEKDEWLKRFKKELRRLVNAVDINPALLEEVSPAMNASKKLLTEYYNYENEKQSI